MNNKKITLCLSLISALSAGGAKAQPAPAPQSPASSPPPIAPSTPPEAPAAAPVGADQPTESRSNMSNAISAFGAIGYSYGFAVGLGVGARYQLTLVPKGFLKPNKRVHDDLGLEPGIDYFHAGYSTGPYSWDYNEVTPLVGVVWNVWLNDKLAVYPKVDIGYRFSSWSESVNGKSTGNAIHADLFPLYFQGAGGIVYRMGIVSLRAEVGWAVLRAGLALNLF